VYFFVWTHNTLSNTDPYWFSHTVQN